MIVEAELECKNDEIASQKRFIDKIKQNPRLVAASASTAHPIEAVPDLRQRVAELERALALEERMRRDAALTAMAREEELRKRIEDLEKENNKIKELNAMQLEQLECRRPTSPNRQNLDDDMGDGTGQEQGTGLSTGAAAVDMSQQQDTEQHNTEEQNTGQGQEAGPSASQEKMSMAAEMKLYQDELIA